MKIQAPPIKFAPGMSMHSARVEQYRRRRTPRDPQPLVVGIVAATWIWVVCSIGAALLMMIAMAGTRASILGGTANQYLDAYMAEGFARAVIMSLVLFGVFGYLPAVAGIWICWMAEKPRENGFAQPLR